MVDARAEIGQKLEVSARLAQHVGAQPVGDRGYQHVSLFCGLNQLVAGHRLVSRVQTRVEQFHQPGFD